jgi:hypothetical protein
MKYLLVFLTLVIGFNSTAQSKKEQIAILANRLDSLNKEYVKDTTYLSNTVETIDREYTIMSMQYEEAQELIKKKSATISEKTNTIESLNEKNMELMEDLKELRLALNSMELENKQIKKSLDSLTTMGKQADGSSRYSIVKIGDLEVMKRDLGIMRQGDAEVVCAETGDELAVGGGWRLPTRGELNVLYENKDVIGGFADDLYWSSTGDGYGNLWVRDFGNGEEYDGGMSMGNNCYVRAVRTVQ